MARILPFLISAALLTWPALLNGYPLVFDDTGTYLSQAVHGYLGWDRPVFYSLFLLPLHLTITTWPVVAVQSLLAVHTLWLVLRVLTWTAPPPLEGGGWGEGCVHPRTADARTPPPNPLPQGEGGRSTASAWWLVPLTAAFALATALPWFTSELMPDLFTPLLVLALALLVLVPERLSGRERIWLTAFSAFMIAAQQSSLPLSLGLLLVLLPLRRVLGAAAPLGQGDVLRAVAPPVLAFAALVAVNAAAFRRVSPSPFGNVFLLARIIYDGPGMHVLRRDCPRIGWRLCTELDGFPTSSDAFLWSPASPILQAGGHKAVSAEADAIIIAALRAEPGAEFKAWLRNGLTQLGEFATGDGLYPCPATVEPWIARDFPRFEYAAYAASRQSNARLLVPPWLLELHRVIAVAGVAACAGVLVLGLRRDHVAAGFAAAVLLAILGNALIAGGLSAPHQRYGSRIMLLAPIVAVLGGAALAADSTTAPRER
jgi:hypothetical protein